jgi:hypothetical protein
MTLTKEALANMHTYYVGFEVLTAVVLKSSEIQCHVIHSKSPDISEEHVTTILGVKE